MYSAGSHDHARPRFAEMSQLLPVFFVLSLVAVLYVVYVCLHCIPLLQLDLPVANQNPDDFARGLRQLVIFHVDTFLLMYCFICCILVHPGTIPSTPEWQLSPEDPVSKSLSGDSRSLTLETKHTGERRHCKWCSRYKPDRCHHCRVCNTCILRMDHHCPWVHNCIGFRNHKYFFLLLLYCVIALNLIVFTMFHSTEQATRDNVPFTLMLLLIFGETLASFLAVLVTSFFFFHIWLMMKAMTTIEFCEKSLKKVGYDASAYSRCSYGNICEVLGPRPALWLLPFSLPEGSGVSWTNEKMPLAAAGSSSSAGIKHRSSGVGVGGFSSSSAGD